MIDQHFSFLGLNSLTQISLSERKLRDGEVGELDESGQKVQTSSYKIKKY